MDTLMKIKQEAIIEEQLKLISDDIQKRVDYAENLVCTVDTIKNIKKQRAILRNQFNDLETQRKQVKAEFQAPYLRFEKVYKELISDKYKNADVQLKRKIDNIESELKLQKENNIREYFNEYCESEGIDFIKFEQIGLNINLSATEKSLREQIKAFVDKVKSDIELIQHEDNFAEIMIEYTKHLNVSRAIIEVKKRHIKLKQMNENKKMSENENQTDKNLQNDVTGLQNEETLKAPEVTYRMTFTVNGTKQQLVKLKQYLKDNCLI